jgi:hypothetical protein
MAACPSDALCPAHQQFQEAYSQGEEWVLRWSYELCASHAANGYGIEVSICAPVSDPGICTAAVHTVHFCFGVDFGHGRQGGRWPPI